MKMKLLILAKSDKNNGYCVVGINRFGKFVRLVKNSEGHALAKGRCNFNKMDFLTVDVLCRLHLFNKKKIMFSAK